MACNLSIGCHFNAMHSLDGIFKYTYMSRYHGGIVQFHIGLRSNIVWKMCCVNRPIISTWRLCAKELLLIF